MKKEVIKPFSLEAYNKGAKVQTRDGHKVRIICTDVNNDSNYHIIALKAFSDGNEAVQIYTSEGKFYTDDNISKNDLVIVQEFWSDKENKDADGYFIGFESDIIHSYAKYTKEKYKYFASKKQAKSALAMAMISQIMANDVENFGGVVTDEEWKNRTLVKYSIRRLNNDIRFMCSYLDYRFLAFHTKDQRDLFLEKYPNLVKDYLMVD